MNSREHKAKIINIRKTNLKGELWYEAMTIRKREKESGYEIKKSILKCICCWRRILKKDMKGCITKALDSVRNLWDIS